MSCTPQGYGQVNRKALGRWATHVLAFTAIHGPVPAGKFVDHICHNNDLACPGGKACWHRPCCNERHLRAVSNAENVDAANEARKRGKFVEACPAMHAYDEVNTGWTWRERKGKPGFWERYCRTCARIRVWESKHPGERHPER